MNVLLGLLVGFAAATDSVLVTTDGVAELKGAIIVDARDSEQFAAGHIPGATLLDVDSLSEERAGVINMLKPMSELRPLFLAAGLKADAPLVVYAGLGDAGDLIRATRLFWALEYAGFRDVRLLDGGLAKWNAEGRGLEKGPSQVVPTKASDLKGLAPREGVYANREDLMAAQAAKKGLIVDLRGERHFSGASKSDYIARGGHVPGALNHPASDLIDGDFTTFRSVEAIREILGADDKLTKEPVVTYCNSGRSATIGYVAYRIAGFEDVAVYDGSMAEWGNREDCPLSSDSNNE